MFNFRSCVYKLYNFKSMDFLSDLFNYSVIQQNGYYFPILIGGLLVFFASICIFHRYASNLLTEYKRTCILDRMCGFHLKVSLYNRPHWIFGHTRQYEENHEGLIKKAKKCIDFPGLFNFHILPWFSFFHLTHPETATPLLLSAAPKDPLVYGFLNSWLGQGLLTSNGEHWRRHRHLITPAFHFNILKSYMSTFNDCTMIMLNKFDKMKDEPIEVFEHVGLLTLDTMLQCAMSSQTDVQSSGIKHPFVAAVQLMSNTILKRADNPLFLYDCFFYLTLTGRQYKQACDIAHEFTKKIIADRRKVIESLPFCDVSIDNELNYQGKKQMNFLDILLHAEAEFSNMKTIFKKLLYKAIFIYEDEHGTKLTEDEIQNEVDTFLFEGHDTTSSGVSWALYNLAKHPEYQEKCREEVKRVVGDKRNVEWTDLPKLEYLTMFIKESLRMYPPVMAIVRRLEKDLPIRSSYNVTGDAVPEGSTVLLQIFALHRNSAVYKDPDVFIPERFTKKNIAKRPAHAFIPFSAGPRNCVGQNFAMNELKVALAQTVRKFRLKLDLSSPEVKMLPHLILQSENGIYICFESV